MNQLDSFCATSHAPDAMEEAGRRVIEGDRMVPKVDRRVMLP